MLRGTLARSWMLLLPVLKLLLSFAAELLFGVRHLRVRLGAATPLRVLRFAFHGFVSGPASVLFLCHADGIRARDKPLPRCENSFSFEEQNLKGNP
jgi:hypothetical protein